MKGKDDMMIMCDMFYYGFHAGYINMYMCLNGIQHMYIVTARMHRMIYVTFYARLTYMSMSSNGIEHMYIVTTRLHMMNYKTSCLDVFICLYFQKSQKACIRLWLS